MTPEQEEQVRRALAALAESDPVGPMPAEVARRLDGVLADLVAEGPTAREGTDELEERRRRRWPKVLVAAAAVAVVAGGTATVLDRGTGAADKASSSQAGGATTGPTVTGTPGAGLQPEVSGSRAPRGQSFAGGAGGTRATGAPSAGTKPSARTGRARSVAPGTRPRPPLRSAQLLRDVQSLVDRGTVGDLSVSGAAAVAALAPCKVPATTPGDRLLAVRLDGRSATLLLSAPVSGRRRAQVYGCGDAQHPEATTTVRDRLTSR